MPERIEFFSPVDSFNFGEANDWHLNTGGSPQQSKSTNDALGKDGDHIGRNEYDKKEQVTCSYVSTKNTGNLALPVVGSIMNGYHVDNFSLSLSQTDFPKLDITGHKHKSGSPDSGCRTYTPSLQIPAHPIGVPSTLAGAYALGAGIPCGMKSLNYSVQVNHQDELNCDGDHLQGDNYDGTETLSLESTGNIDEDDLTLEEGWAFDSSGKNQSNTAATTSSFNLTKHIAHDVTDPTPEA